MSSVPRDENRVTGLYVLGSATGAGVVIEGDETTKGMYVQIVGDDVGIGGGTQYTEGDTDATITGSAMMMEVAANALQPVQGTVADGILVNLGTNNDVSVTGTVTANLSATDNAVLDAIQAAVDAVFGAAAPTVDSYADDPISAVTGANQSLVGTPGANKQIWVHGIQFTTTVAGTVALQDEDDTAITGTMNFDQYSGLNSVPSGNFAQPLWKVATNKALEADVTTATINGSIQYAIVSV